MEEVALEEHVSAWEESHPWLTLSKDTAPQDDEVDEVIRYTLDEIRFA